MHYLVGIITSEPERIETILEPFGQDSPDYYERVPFMSREQYLHEFHATHPYTTFTDEYIWERFAPQEYNDVDLEGGMIYEHYNTNTQWDWYVVGGRFGGTIRVLKKDALEYGYIENTDRPQRGRKRRVNAAPINKILWSDMNRPTKDNIEMWGNEWDNSAPDSYMRRKYRTKENYIMKNSLHIPYAFVNEEDGEWHSYENGDYNNYDDYTKAFYDCLADNLDKWYVIVDCHL